MRRVTFLSLLTLVIGTVNQTLFEQFVSAPEKFPPDNQTESWLACMPPTVTQTPVPLIYTLTETIMTTIRDSDNITSDCRHHIELAFAQKTRVERYFDLHRSNANQLLALATLTSIHKVASIFNVVPGINITVDVETRCAVETTVTLQFPKECPAAPWYVDALLGGVGAIASYASPVAGLAFGMITSAVGAIAGGAEEANTCSDDFRNTKAEATSSAICASVARAYAHIDQSLSISDKNSYDAYKQHQLVVRTESTFETVLRRF